jgi:hypothetical protein
MHQSIVLLLARRGAAAELAELDAKITDLDTRRAELLAFLQTNGAEQPNEEPEPETIPPTEPRRRKRRPLTAEQKRKISKGIRASWKARKAAEENNQ